MDSVQKKNIIKIVICVLIAIWILNKLIHCSKKDNLKALPPVTVVFAKPETIKMTEFITKTGNAVAYNSVNLVARVKGYLNAITYDDGALVHKGQDLFLLETDPYEEQLDEANASVAAYNAANTYNKLEYARQKQMYKDNATSLNSVQQWQAKVAESTAQVAKAEAQAKSARVNLSYTHVRAPFDGRVGRHLLDPGNLVGDGAATKLAVIEQISPIYIYFNFDEFEVNKIRDIARAHNLNYQHINQLTAYVSMQTTHGVVQKGQINFVSTGLNTSTGTLEFRALLANKDYTILPGMFVQVRVAISQPLSQLTVPDTALQYDQIGSYLLVVNQDNNVVLKRVVIGGIEQGKRAILKGISAQDKVIIDGLQYATPGNRVNPVDSRARKSS